MERVHRYLAAAVGLSTDEWSLLRDHVKLRSLRKGEFLIEEGKVARSSGLLIEGVVRYFGHDADGNDPTCYFSYETHYLCDPFTFRQQTPAVLNVQAVTTCIIAVVDVEADRRLRTAFPRWATITDKLLLDVSLVFGDQKKLLSMSAEERYDYFVRTYPSVSQRAPLGYVASYLGITQPSLSRLRRKRVTGGR